MTEIITDSITLVLVHVSFALCVVLLVVIRKRPPSNFRAAFMALAIVMFVWNLGTLFEVDSRLLTGVTTMVFIDISYIGVCFSPIALLYFGKTVFEPYWRPTPIFALTLVIPVISLVMVWTNTAHHLFFEKFSLYSNEAVYGVYFYFHSAYSYIIILIGMIYLLAFAMRNIGIFSKQSALIMIGIAVPLAGNVTFSFGTIGLSFAINASLFTFAALCFLIAFYRFRFLTSLPISVRQVVDLISDGYLVIDNQFNVVDYNRPFAEMMPKSFHLTKDTKLSELFDACEGGAGYTDYIENVYRVAVRENRTVSAERQFNDGRYVQTETTPIFLRSEQIGSILLLWDVTQAKQAAETIKETQAMMIDRERLISLGQIAGGIAHNLRTPILSIAGGLVALGDLVKEYRTSIDDPDVTPEDHREIAAEMEGWIAKIEEHCDYLSELVTTIKGQAVSLSSNETDRFTVGDLVKRIELLMTHELKKYHGELVFEIEDGDIGEDSEIAGDISSLVQVFDNLIINALHAYHENEAEGKIIINIQENGKYYRFTVTDFAGGMPPEIQSRVFKKMVTTKGKMGTGLGLYVSYSTIKGKFHGQMSVESETGVGTVFTILIPVPDGQPLADAFRSTGGFEAGEEGDSDAKK